MNDIEGDGWRASGSKTVGLVVVYVERIRLLNNLRMLH